MTTTTLGELVVSWSRFESVLARSVFGLVVLLRISECLGTEDALIECEEAMDDES